MESAVGRPGLAVPSRYVPLVIAVSSALAFAVLRPPVGDLWAALARQSAAEAGVGTAYWFSWYSGGAPPGSYSVLTPLLSALLTAPVLGALSAAAVTPLTAVLVRDTLRPRLAVWTATVGAAASLWSGRVPFTLGAAFAVGALVALRSGRRVAGVALTLLAVLASPVAGAFLLLALVIDAWYRRGCGALSAAVPGAVALLALELWFGMPGPEGFGVGASILSLGALLALLLGRPSRPVVLVIVLVAVALPVLGVVPNGMGSNLERLLFGALPVAVAATGRAARRWVVAATAPALVLGLVGTATDLAVAAAPSSQRSYYTSLVAEARRLPGLADHRLEVAQDGTHTAAYALLGSAWLARGYETQADNQLDGVLNGSGAVDEAAFRRWLSDNAVGYVAVSTHPVQRTTEISLLTERTPGYLHEVWHDARWRLYAVARPTPIVSSPAVVVATSQASMTVRMPSSGEVRLRLRWSRLLDVDGPAEFPVASLRPTADGWTTMAVPAAGTYTLRGASFPEDD